jgi:hypothetical protein
LHITLLKRGRQLFAAYQKSLTKIRERYQPIGRKGLKFIRNTAYTPSLQTSFGSSEAFSVKWQKTYKFDIMLKGEFTKY